MTYEEAISELCDICTNVLEFKDNRTQMSFKMAIDALERAEKYRWHDLRKDTNDLPKKDGEYYAYQYCHYCRTADPNSEVCEPMYTIIFVEDGKIIDCYEGGEIIAWKEIEPFEVTE